MSETFQGDIECSSFVNAVADIEMRAMLNKKTYTMGTRHSELLGRREDFVLKPIHRGELSNAYTKPQYNQFLKLCGNCEAE